MKLLSVIVIIGFLMGNMNAQTPDWLTPTGDYEIIMGSSYSLYENRSGGYAIHLRGKYFLYYVNKVSKGGETIYLSKKGTPFIIIEGKNGPYAKYGVKE